MKLILAIVSNDDSKDVSKALIKQSFQVTKLSTTGSFLSVGNTTLIIGCNDELVEKAIEIIGSQSKTRTEIIPSALNFGSSTNVTMPLEVKVGGATIFVIDVAQFIKL